MKEHENRYVEVVSMRALDGVNTFTLMKHRHGCDMWY